MLPSVILEISPMRTKRSLHKPSFKAKVALTAIKGEMTMAEMVKRFDVRAAQITQWKSSS